MAPAIDALLRDAERALERAGGPDVPAQYEALSAVLDTAVERLSRAWGTVGHLNQVCDTPALRAAFNECLPRVTGLLCAAGRRHAPVRQVSGDRPRCRGAGRAAPPRARQCAARFRARWRAAAGHGPPAVPADPGSPGRGVTALRRACAGRDRRICAGTSTPTRLDGVPDDVRAALRADAAADGRDGFKLSLLAPRWLPVMQYATDRALRERLYRAFHTRASELGPSRVRQQRADDRIARVASGERQAAAVRRLCAAVAGHQDGAHAGAGAAVPARPRDTLARAGAARARRHARVRPRSSSASTRDAMGSPLRRRAAARAALRVQRPGGQALLHVRARARRVVSHRRDAVRAAHHARPGRGVARQRACLSHRARRRAGGPVLPRRVLARRQAPRRLDGRRARPLASPRWRACAANAGGLPGVQLRAAAARARCAAHPQRPHHAVPRVRPRTAPHADARRRAGGGRHRGRRVGRGGAAEPVHGELLLGVGGAVAPERARRRRRRRCRARCSTR